METLGNLYESAYGTLGYGSYWERLVAVPPDTLLAAIMPGGVTIWRKEFSEEAGMRWRDHMVLRGHQGQIASMLIGLDSQYIATGGEDGTVRIWNVSKEAGLNEADEPETIEELLLLARQRVQRNPPEFTCDERVEYLHEALDCPLAPTP
jgi:hypothetical protein